MKFLVQILFINMETVIYDPSFKKKKILTSQYICPHLITYFYTLVTSYIIRLMFKFYWKHFMPPLLSSNWTFIFIN